jgi:hypothetical protein
MKLPRFKDKRLYLVVLFIFLLIILCMRSNKTDGFVSRPSPASGDVDSDLRTLTMGYGAHIGSAISGIAEQNKNFPTSLTPVITSINTSMQKISKAYGDMVEFLVSSNVINKTYFFPIVLKAASDAITTTCSGIISNPKSYLNINNI